MYSTPSNGRYKDLTTKYNNVEGWGRGLIFRRHPRICLDRLRKTCRNQDSPPPYPRHEPRISTVKFKTPSDSQTKIIVFRRTCTLFRF